MKNMIASWSILCSILITPLAGFAVEPLQITPKTLEARILSDNYDVRQGQIDVVNARDQFLKTKLALLPSLSGTLTVDSGPLFAARMIACLVPFIVPGKWYDMSAAGQRERAALSGLYTLQLNTYAMAYTLIRTHVADRESLVQYEERYNRIKGIYDRQLKLIDLKVARPSSAYPIANELGKAEADWVKVQAEISRQKAQMRMMIGLSASDTEDDIQISLENSIRPTRLEAIGNVDSAKRVFFRSPERTQLLHLKKAADLSKSSTAWSFVNGCAGSTMQTQYLPNGQMTQVAPGMGYANGLSVNLSATLYADLSLAQNTIDQYGLSLEKAQSQMGAVLTETLARLKTEKKLLEVYGGIKDRAVKLYDEKLRLYELGVLDIPAVAEANNSVTLAELDLIRSRMNIDGHRITLKRLHLDEEFMDIYVASRKKFELN